MRLFLFVYCQPASFHLEGNRCPDSWHHVLHLVHRESQRRRTYCPPALETAGIRVGVGYGDQHHVVHQQHGHSRHVCLFFTPSSLPTLNNIGQERT